MNKESTSLSEDLTQRIDKTRFSLRIPTKQSIQLQMLADQLKRNRNDIIVEAIFLYLTSHNQKQDLEEELNKLKKEVNKIKEIIKFKE